MVKRILATAVGFILGVILIPLIAPASPFIVAWIFWNEFDDEDDK